MASNCSSEIPLVLNPDISGVGVRVSFYLQTFLLVFLVDRSWQEAPTALWTFIATSFGLTIAAVAQAVGGNLTLFQALQVLNLVWLANFGTFLALASYSRRKSGHSHHKGKESKGKLHKPENYVKFGAMLQTLLSMILTEWLWVHVSVFNNICSPNVNYVLFVIKTNAVGSGRIVALTLTSLLAAAYAAVTFHELRAYYRSYRQRKPPQTHRKNSPDEKVTNLRSPTSALGSFSPGPIEHIESEGSSSPTTNPNAEPTSQLSPIADLKNHKVKNHGTSKVHRPRRKQWSGNWDPMLLGITAFQLVIFAYFVVSTELLLWWNPHQNDGQIWGFGQILALIVTIPSALAVFNAFSEHGFRRLHRRRKPRRGKSKQASLPEEIV